jgi:pyruvate dehydrogenase E1 component subunit alpha
VASVKKAKSDTSKSISNTSKLPDAAELKKLYRNMLLIRRFEEKAGQLYGMGLIGGFCHLYIGQEAIVTGIQSVQEPQDTVITTYRDHAHMLACGMDAKGIMAELTGRIGGYSHGKGGSMHMFSSEAKFYGGHGIVGASASLGTGLAFAHQYSGDKGVAVVYSGDGAANQGQMFECMNMAALWKLPVLYIIENNQYGMGTSAARHAAGELYKRGEAFGIPGEKVDGSDVLIVQNAARMALDHVRSGKGPYVLEMNTYRFRGHSMSDPGKYRSKEELEKAKQERDPVEKLKALMMAELDMAETDFDAFEKDIKAIVVEAAEFSQQSPEPDPSELWTDILKPVEA